MFASVTSMLVRGRAVGFQLFQALLAVVQLWPLGPVLQIFFQGSLQGLGGELARFHGQGNGFLGDFFLQFSNPPCCRKFRKAAAKVEPPAAAGKGFSWVDAPFGQVLGGRPQSGCAISCATRDA